MCAPLSESRRQLTKGTEEDVPAMGLLRGSSCLPSRGGRRSNLENWEVQVFALYSPYNMWQVNLGNAPYSVFFLTATLSATILHSGEGRAELALPPLAQGETLQRLWGVF